MEDFPIGTRVMTPTGRIGVVVKHHMTSKIDCFQRVSVQFGKNPRDGVVLQPHLLTMLPDLANEAKTWHQLALDLSMPDGKKFPTRCIDKKIKAKETHKT